jgi:hypothetical protein
MTILKNAQFTMKNFGMLSNKIYQVKYHIRFKFNLYVWKENSKNWQKTNLFVKFDIKIEI